MSGSRRRVGIKTANRGIPNRDISGRHARIERDAQDGPVRQDRVTAGDIDPITLIRHACAQVKSDLHVAIICADYCDALIFGRVFDLVDVRTISESSFGQARVCAARARGGIGAVPG
jgi:hypothetical protein